MRPDALNYHHLLYFWAVAKEGSLLQFLQRGSVGGESRSADRRWKQESGFTILNHEYHRRRFTANGAAEGESVARSSFKESL